MSFKQELKKYLQSRHDNLSKSSGDEVDIRLNEVNNVAAKFQIKLK